jgi:hypothetical protein
VPEPADDPASDAVVDDLGRALERAPCEVVVGWLRDRLGQLGASMFDGRAIPRREADALAARLIEQVRSGLGGALAGRPGDALRVLDVLRSTGYPALEAERAGIERVLAERFPPPPAVTWRELAELRALAIAEPGLCRLGPPVAHVEFAARLAATGTELPGELLALYAACGYIALGGRRVAGPVGGICAGDALRVRDGRVILFDRERGHPRTLMVEQPGVSIAQLLGAWWLVLEDDRAPAIKRPLDLQALVRFALRRVEAPSMEALLTDLAWRRFFA